MILRRGETSRRAGFPGRRRNAFRRSRSLTFAPAESVVHAYCATKRARANTGARGKANRQGAKVSNFIVEVRSSRRNREGRKARDAFARASPSFCRYLGGLASLRFHSGAAVPRGEER